METLETCLHCDGTGKVEVHVYARTGVAENEYVGVEERICPWCFGSGKEG